MIQAFAVATPNTIAASIQNDSRATGNTSLPEDSRPAAQPQPAGNNELPNLDDEYDLERASTASSIPLGDMAGASQGKHYQPKQDIICRIEHIPERDMKVLHLAPEAWKLHYCKLTSVGTVLPKTCLNYRQKVLAFERG